MKPAINFCDPSDPAVEKIAKTLPKDPRLYVIAAFNWVRDSIKYTVLHNWSVPVSYTLRRRKGNCGTKACLLVALLRARGIEAEFCVELIDTQTTFFFVPVSVSGICNKKSVHFFVAVKLDKEWVHIDPTTDWKLAEGMSGVAGDTFKVEFDGYSDATACNSGTVEQMPSIDHFMVKTSRVTPEVRECFNLSAEFCRREGKNYKDARALYKAAEEYIVQTNHSVISEAILFVARQEPAPPNVAEQRGKMYLRSVSQMSLMKTLQKKNIFASRPLRGVDKSVSFTIR